MGRESREVWEKRVTRWRDSGLSAREFADETGVNVHTLSHWAWRLGRVEAPVAAEQGPRPTPRADATMRRKVAPAAWLEVVTEHGPAESAPAFELVVAGRTIRVPAGFDADSLRRLLAVVEAR